MIGGVTLTDKKLVEILEKNKIEVPEALAHHRGQGAVVDHLRGE